MQPVHPGLDGEDAVGRSRSVFKNHAEGLFGVVYNQVTTDANIFNSPYYYLQQNDIIYVEPSSVKTKGADLGPTTSMWFSFIGIATSLASLIVSVLRN